MHRHAKRRRQRASAPGPRARKSGSGRAKLAAYAGAFLCLVALVVYATYSLEETQSLAKPAADQGSDRPPSKPQPSASGDVLPPQQPRPVEHPLLQLLSVSDGSVERVAYIEKEIAEQTLKDHPREVDALVLKGTILQYHGQSDEARPYFEKALEREPQRANLYTRLGTMASNGGDPNGAIAVWRRGLARAKDPSGLRWHIANALTNLGKHREARDMLHEECRVTPQASRNYYLLGQINSHLGDYQQARENYEKTLRLDPDHHNAYYALGMLHRMCHRRALAKQCLEAFRTLQAKTQQRQDERDRLGDLGRARQRAAHICWLAHKLYTESKRTDIAGFLLAKAAELDPMNETYLLRRVYLALSREDLAGAVALYESARAIDANNISHYINLGKLASRMNQFARAEQILEEAIERFSESDVGPAALANFYLANRRRPARAISLAQQAVQRRPAASNYLLLGRAQEVNGNLDSALAAIETAVQLEPNNPKYQEARTRVKGQMALQCP